MSPDASPRASDLQPPAPPTPLAGATLALLSGIALSEVLGRAGAGTLTFAFVGSAALLGSAVVTPSHLRRWGAAALLLGALGGGFLRHQWSLRLPADHVANWATGAGQLTRVAGRIVSSPTVREEPMRNPDLPFKPEPRTRFLLELDELRSGATPAHASGLLRVSVNGPVPQARFGARVELLGRVFRIADPQNPGEVDWSTVFRRQGIYAGMSVEPVELVQVQARDAPSALVRFVAALRARAAALLLEPGANVDPGVAALLDAMVLGQRSAVDAAINDAFMRTGAIHLLSVSGFHVGILGGAVWWTVRGLRRGGGSRLAAGVTALVLILYALLAEPNAPILRATVMGLLLSATRLLGRATASLNWLALSAALLALLDPQQVFQAGFQLSFIQVWFMLTALPRVQRWLWRTRDDEPPRDALTAWAVIGRIVLRALSLLTITSLGCWLVAIPLCLFHFQRFAPWSGIDSIVLTPLATVITLLGFITLVTQALLPPLGAVCSQLLVVSSGWLIGLARELARLPGTLIETSPPPLLLLSATLVGLAIVVHARPAARAARQVRLRPTTSARLLRAIPLPIALAWLAWLVVPANPAPDVPTLHVLSVGNGSAALLVLPDASAAVFDVGTNRNVDAGVTLRNAARAVGARRIDWLTLSHADFDHFSGAPTACAALPVRQVAAPIQFVAELRVAQQFTRLRAALAVLDQQVRPLAAGETLPWGAHALEVLWPPRDLSRAASDNDSSLVLRARLPAHVLLVAGDIEQEAQLGLLAAHAAGAIDLRADVLIAPHHGSVRPSATAEFLSAVAPRWIIASNSEARPALAELAASVLPRATVLQTGRVGAVAVRFQTDGKLTVTTATSRARADAEPESENQP